MTDDSTPLEDPLGIYVHWPWCRSKCPYCDFNSHVADAIDQDRWRSALLRELSSASVGTTRRLVESIYFGGGTPSLMDPRTAAEIIDFVKATWSCVAALEVTLEANPSTVETSRFTAFRDAGVNRVSVGVQSFDERALQFLGRNHTVDDGIGAIETAHTLFERVSFDLIYAFPGQSVADWQKHLDMAVPLAGDHLSLYQLTIEQGTAFYRNGVTGCDEDTGVALFEITMDRLRSAGFPAYEISNHARHNGACRHNLRIWQGGDYVGIGPGSHGRLTSDGKTVATTRTSAPNHWLNEVAVSGGAATHAHALTSEERLEEIVMLGLRLTDGINRDQFWSRTGRNIEDAVNRDGLNRLVEESFVTIDAAGLRTTPKGRLCLNSITGQLLA